MLVATTVIEVGVDVPERDGDGRSRTPTASGCCSSISCGAASAAATHVSCCYLLAEPTTPQGEARMEAMVESGDGFELAERDLAIRGAGEVFGERQAGVDRPQARPAPAGRADRDRGARAWPSVILDDDPDLEQHAQLREEVEDLLGDAVEFLFKS